MNIFVVDKDPKIAAKSLCDKHVIKMILESAQLLSTHDRLNGLAGERYKITHINHPCRVSLNNESNYIWLCKHLNYLLEEYTRRFNKIHKTTNIFLKYWKQFVILNNNKCQFVQCMPDEFKNDDVVFAYRSYYKYKSKIMKSFKYTNSNKPYWLNGENND